tara:strand:+ start:364 stop:744 length:381 start_codon:yes stop_codon:yes gene_type:complete
MEEDCKANSEALRLAKQAGGGGGRMRERVLRVAKSAAKGKKYAATVKNLETGKTRIINFGGLGYAQYKDRTDIGLYSHLDHGDRARMGRYFLRHSGTRNRTEAISKEKAKSDGHYNAKILSHELLW